MLSVKPPVKLLEVHPCQETDCTEYAHHVGNSVVFQFCAQHLQDVNEGKELVLKGESR